MEIVKVLGRDIIVSSGITELITKELSAYKSSTLVVVTDANVAALHLQPLLAGLHSKRVLSYIMPSGEVHKTRETKAAIEDYMLSNNCTRDSVIVALGGGVVGDLAGFVAATFMRGIPFFQIPTTLLAMVDSSIGGKTAIDTLHGKNLIGSFHQPEKIFVDIDYLSTLPMREFVNGMAEVIKTAAIWSLQDFITLENNRKKCEVLLSVILGSINVKAYIVTNDEKEGGLRGILNFGHSVGHAIEAKMFPELLHGECVSIGMLFEAEVARHLGFLNSVSVGRLSKCLQAYGLPISLNESFVKQKTLKTCSVDEILNYMKIDKKNQGNQKFIVLLDSIGSTLEKKAIHVDDRVIARVLAPSLQVTPPSNQLNPIALDVPGSKSISNRALLMAAMGKGTCRLKGLLYSDDVQVMLTALEKLMGITYIWEDNGNTLQLTGGAGMLKVPGSEIYLGNAGTASRFLTSICTLVKTDRSQAIVLTGNARMKQRPIGPLVSALESNGCKIEYLESANCFPLKIHTSSTGLKGGKINLSASVSSQYVSSILISAPYALDTVILDLSGDNVISQPYIDMTIAMMKSFGVTVQRVGETNQYTIPSGCYINPAEYIVEADASSATYPLAFAAITGSTVTVGNIGRDSLQGDSAFAVQVLGQMGCIVSQTAKTTTVQGPPVLKPLKMIDMETMTDAFMTATVLAAVAQGESDHVTRIVGIANQRVKECDRIAVMIEQLAKFGVKANELPDGIEIHGIKAADLQVTSPIKCYDDHRIAMSFSVLSCAIQGDKCAVITEKKCVEKTWPSWWDTLQSMGVDLVGVDQTEDERSEPHDNLQSLILVGFRGVGKTKMGQIAAKHLGYDFIDLDHELEKKVSQTIPDFVTSTSWERFREMESEILKVVLSKHPQRTVISCGGGIIETAENVDILCKHGNVVHLMRDFDIVEKYLNQDKSRPSFSQENQKIWLKRRPLYEKCSNYEFLSLFDDDKPSLQENVRSSWSRFVDLITGNFKPPTQSGTFFVSLTCSTVQEISPILKYISQGANAVELRVDLLQSYEPDFIRQQVAQLRALTTVPLIYTVRTQSQGGKFPYGFDNMIQILQYGARLGCEFVDIEFTQPYNRFLTKQFRNSLIIGSFHDIHGNCSWKGRGKDTFQTIYDEISPLCDVVKLIGVAKNISDNFQVADFKSHNNSKPLIALLMGNLGKISRALNDFLTPVTHPKIPIPAAPGQLTIPEINLLRVSMGLFDNLEFYLGGHPIQKSMSPALHNSGFESMGLPYKYGLLDTANIQDVKNALLKSTVGGFSITIPLKTEAIGICNQISDSAKAVGAVNTIIKSARGLEGYNTDWVGIINCLKMRMDFSKRYDAIVIGAGGTSRAAIYALQKLESVHDIFIHNRTIAKAEQLAQEFGAQVLNSDWKKHNNLIIIGTIPAEAQGDYEWVLKDCQGIVVDMAYLNGATRLLEQAEAHNFIVIRGIEVLLEQGYAQFELFTKMQAPRQSICETVMQRYLP